MPVRLATTADEIRACHAVMQQLRPAFGAEELATQVLRQMDAGYRLAYLTGDGDTIVAVAGYRISENLAWGKNMYVDDLVTDAVRRSAGHGQALMDWLVQTARDAGCRELHLDSGVQRFAAHRFYLRYGMDINSHHFAMKLT